MKRHGGFLGFQQRRLCPGILKREPCYLERHLAVVVDKKRLCRLNCQTLLGIELPIPCDRLAQKIDHADTLVSLCAAAVALAAWRWSGLGFRRGGCSGGG